MVIGKYDFFILRFYDIVLFFLVRYYRNILNKEIDVLFINIFGEGNFIDFFDDLFFLKIYFIWEIFLNFI